MKETLLKYHMDSSDIIKYQVLSWCYINGFLTGTKERRITFTEIDCMTLIGIYGTIPMTTLCNELVKYKVFSNTQSVRNTLSKLITFGLVEVKESAKREPGRKSVSLSPDIKVVSGPDITVGILMSTDKNKLISTHEAN
jgi:hypothetical protein